MKKQFIASLAVLTVLTVASMDYKNLLTTLILLIITVGVVFADTKIPVQLIKIKDGDTVDVRIEKNTFPVRLIGIDCYETGRIHRAYHLAYDNNLSIDEVIARGKQSTVNEDLQKNGGCMIYDYK